jgi:hypothetical protein
MASYTGGKGEGEEIKNTFAACLHSMDPARSVLLGLLAYYTCLYNTQRYRGREEELRVIIEVRLSLS